MKEKTHYFVYCHFVFQIAVAVAVAVAVDVDVDCAEDEVVALTAVREVTFFYIVFLPFRRMRCSVYFHEIFRLI